MKSSKLSLAFEKCREENKRIGQELTQNTTEHWGVGIAIKKEWNAIVEEIVAVNKRIMYMVIRANVDIVVIVGYAPTSVDTEENKDLFYNKLQEIWDIKGNHVFKILMGDFNAKIAETLCAEDDEIAGRFFLKEQITLPLFPWVVLTFPQMTLYFVFLTLLRALYKKQTLFPQYH